MSHQPDTQFLSRAGGISYDNFSFNVSYKDPKSRARLGRMETPHGGFDTPNFIFCGFEKLMAVLFSR